MFYSALYLAHFAFTALM